MEGSFVGLIMERVYLVQSIYNTDKKGDSIIDNYIFDSDAEPEDYGFIAEDFEEGKYIGE